MIDARYYQIAILSSLLIYGISFGLLEIDIYNTLFIFISTQLTQFIFCYFLKIKFEFKSSLITCLSLIILLRTGIPAIAAFAGFIAISSKFMVRSDGKHIFNPANIALVIVSAFTGLAWISTGQWGSFTWFAMLLVTLGIMILQKTRQLDISLSFIAIYGAILFLRAFYVGDPIEIPIHQMQNGALLLFTFFMISDPKTIPNARIGRVLFAAIVAIISAILQFYFYVSVAIIYALAICSPIVPIIDKKLISEKYGW